MQIHATDSVEVFGTTPGAEFRTLSEPPNSEISAAVAPESTGNGGSLSIDTGKLIIRDSGMVTVRNEGKGGTSQAGNSVINARSINLDQGTITATTNSGNGGDIILTLKDLLLLRNQSSISTTAGTAQQGEMVATLLLMLHRALSSRYQMKIATSPPMLSVALVAKLQSTLLVFMV
ncbi:hypothetical protein NIES2101_17880 [Calothrix sp. HK-06]|nr:hypothetical protein NIES2101_17880 [Calothrix sp. HK-06]